MIKITFQLVLICLLICSCKETSKEPGQKLNKREDEKLKEALNELIKSKAVAEMTYDSKYDVRAKFSDMTILLQGMNLFWWEDDGDYHDNMYATEKDTVYFNLIPGDEAFERPFRIEQSEFEILELYGQFEVKISLETERELEVPVCILEDWKGYTSKWEKLKIDKKHLKFGTINEKINYSIPFTLDEFKLAAEEHCGPEWLNDIKHIKNVNKLPTSHFTTHYIYKLKIRNSKTKEVLEKFIVFYTPTSC